MCILHSTLTLMMNSTSMSRVAINDFPRIVANGMSLLALGCEVA